MSGTVSGALGFWARTKPGCPAIDFDGDVVDYRELSRWVDAVGHDLLDRGVRAGDRVGYLGANSLEWCVAALAAWKIGAIAAPFNNRMVAAELAGVVTECEPEVVYCDTALRARLDQTHEMIPTFHIATFEQDVRPLRAQHTDPLAETMADVSAPTAIVFTSGSTGRPKGVVYTHAGIAGVMHDWALMEPTSAQHLRPLMVLPLFTAGGIIWGIARTVIHGGTLLLQPRFDPEAALRVLVEDKPNTLTGPPIIFEQIAKVEAFATADLSHLTTAHVGGARVPADVFAAWSPRGVVLRQLYGQTEIGGSATVTPVDEAHRSTEMCGSGTTFTRIRVVDTELVDCPPGEPGEILLRGPGLMAGYWRNEKATRETIIDGWLRTGDLGKLDENGNLTFVDRLKDMIISGGLNISPAEVEAVIGSLAGVEEVAVISVADTKFGETPAAIVRAAPNVTERVVVEHCNLLLADFKVPRYVVMCHDPLPRMASGKIAKVILRERYSTIPERYARVR